MKKRFIVIGYMLMDINCGQDGTDTREVLTPFLEGVYNNLQDAEDRLNGMVEEETQPGRPTDMYFEIKEVYCN